MKKVLLLNSTMEVIAFITERKAIKLVYKEKVDTIATWADMLIRFGNKEIYFPAVIKLRYYIKKSYSRLIFSRKAVFRRDNYTCQYCAKRLKPGQATMDHILPKSMGGISSFTNCVAACLPCNAKKSNKLPDVSNMWPITMPTHPVGYLYSISENDCWHDDWEKFLGGKSKI
jgi:hypothetical protein